MRLFDTRRGGITTPSGRIETAQVSSAQDTAAIAGSSRPPSGSGAKASYYEENCCWPQRGLIASLGGGLSLTLMVRDGWNRFR